MAPQVSHFRQVPLRTMVNEPQSPQASPVYPWSRAASANDMTGAREVVTLVFSATTEETRTDSAIA